MPFLTRTRQTIDAKPVIIYMHETGYGDAFGHGDTGIAAGSAHVEGIFRKHRDMLTSADYVLAALWGDSGAKVAELWGYGDLKEWNKNPTAYPPWVFRGGLYIKEPESVGCGDMTIAFGREEEFRRASSSPEDFLSRWPELPEGLLHDVPAR